MDGDRQGWAAPKKHLAAKPPEPRRWSAATARTRAARGEEQQHSSAMHASSALMSCDFIPLTFSDVVVVFVDRLDVVLVFIDCHNPWQRTVHQGDARDARGYEMDAEWAQNGQRARTQP